MHTLLWASKHSLQAYQPLSKEQSSQQTVHLELQWRTDIAQARQACQAAVNQAIADQALVAAPATAIFAPYATGEGTPARGLTHTEAQVWCLAREGAVYAVVCAMAFEVMGEAAGLLPRGGWLRAQQIMQRCLVCILLARSEPSKYVRSA